MSKTPHRWVGRLDSKSKLRIVWRVAFGPNGLHTNAAGVHTSGKRDTVRVASSRRRVVAPPSRRARNSPSYWQVVRWRSRARSRRSPRNAKFIKKKSASLFGERRLAFSIPVWRVASLATAGRRARLSYLDAFTRLVSGACARERRTRGYSATGSQMSLFLSKESSLSLVALLWVFCAAFSDCEERSAALAMLPVGAPCNSKGIISVHPKTSESLCAHTHTHPKKNTRRWARRASVSS